MNHAIAVLTQALELQKIALTELQTQVDTCKKTMTGLEALAAEAKKSVAELIAALKKLG